MNDSDLDSIDLVCIYSLPRSGSTVLIAELESIEGVICMPESYFPQVFEFLSEEEKRDVDVLASYFMASCPSGSLLTFDEVKECLVIGDFGLTLRQLGLKVAEKTNKDIEKVKVVIWKTTRIVSRWKAFSSAGGRFVVLRRDVVNVFDSQFRVNFGVHNRNPLRFAMFRESYESIFDKMPKEKTFYIDYKRIPETMAEFSEWLGLDSDVRWEQGDSSIGLTHAKNEWHGGLMSGFKSTDHIKRKNISLTDRALLKIGMYLARPVRGGMYLLRKRYDSILMEQVSRDAQRLRGSEGIA